MRLFRLARTAGCVADNPARGIATGDRDQRFARLQDDVRHEARRSIGEEDRAFAVGIDLRTVDEPGRGRCDRRRTIGGRDMLDRLGGRTSLGDRRCGDEDAGERRQDGEFHRCVS